MKRLAILHRWLGATAGIVLLLMGVSGTLLANRSSWIGLPHAQDTLVQDAGQVAAATTRLLTQTGQQPEALLLASEELGLHRLTFTDGSGAYSDQKGNLVARWKNQLQRPELWMLDFHKHFFQGGAGQWVVFALGLAALFSVVSGIALWTRTRKMFAPTLLPQKLTRASIIKHHRDLGVIVAPLLLLSLLTGAVIAFQPLAKVMGRVGTPALPVTVPVAPGRIANIDLAGLDWAGMLATAKSQFPEAQLRSIAFPREPGGLAVIRMKQPWEWQPNGTTNLWFNPATAQLIGTKNPAATPAYVRAYYMVYPTHTASVGGIWMRLLVSLSGLSLTLMGALAIWSFWRGRKS